MASRDTAPRPDPSYELGDLELAALPMRKPEAPAPASAPSAESDADLPTLSDVAPANDTELRAELGLGGDPFGDALMGPDLELDLDHAPAAPAQKPSRAPDSARPSVRAPSSMKPHASSGSMKPHARESGPAPSSGRPGRTTSGRPEDDSARLEREARELSRYGVAPDGFPAAAQYLLHVGVRAIALYRERRAVEADAGERADAYERALDALGRALLSDGEVRAHAGLAKFVADAEAHKQKLAEIEAASADVQAREERALAALEREKSALEAELAPYREEEQRLAAQHHKLESELKRKEAQIKRAEIELRAIARASVPTPEQRVQSIESDRKVRSLEITELTALYQESLRALAQARRELEKKSGGLAALERRHEQRMSQARMLHGRIDADVARAGRALRGALCALAEAADKLGVAHRATAEIEAVRSAEHALDAEVERLTRYDRALSAYDRDALWRGAIAWIVLVIAVVALFSML